MKKILFVLLAVIMVVSVMAIPALATSPDNAVGGRWCYGDLIQEEIKTAGGNVFYNLDDSGAWFGTFNGYSSDDGNIMVQSSGHTILKSKVSFESVQVGGKEGGLEILVNGRLPAGAPLSEYEGMWVITSGTGDLSGLRGQGTWGGVELDNPDCLAIEPSGKFFASVPYSGKIHFENE